VTSSLRNQLISEAAQSVSVLAKAVQADGDTVYSEALFRQAADLELASAELQACWGGAFNGQHGRQAIVQDLLDRLAPAAVVETGTFRGISTEWIAERYQGPIFTCEKERLYYYQAEKRLQKSDNVTRRIQDSREFLRDIVRTLPTDRPILFYLDAHWELDLPLQEELQIIFGSPCRAVVLVDDFQVPDDAGYTWDDYGEGKALVPSLVGSVLPGDTTLYFPTLPSAQENGALRGCCVIVRGGTDALDDSPLLRSGSLAYWMSVAPDAKAPETELKPNPGDVLRAGSAETDALRRQLDMCEADRAQRLSSIITLTAETADLRGRLASSEADREARLHGINKLTALLAESEEDRAQRLVVINSLVAELESLRIEGATLKTIDT